ncbi:hypothetical protein MAR_011954 [Mya arenaria]|uniref:Uncharacterized protein n=1 Tax=Mya arenaria TaxID=6604 RepID=A0ABY7FYV9_MYAAR|nr:hypothetical protein MAR_011936 [Mya arenaria]WAR26250.1 hypothetical protein MAR_011954 [Mya arenaria]
MHGKSNTRTLSGKRKTLRDLTDNYAVVAYVRDVSVPALVVECTGRNRRTTVADEKNLPGKALPSW